MKLVGIFRGFPGLGRVVSGIELVREAAQCLHAEVRVFTYLQGYDYAAKVFGRTGLHNVLSPEDISSIGIIPVSPSGEKIIDEIEAFQPDCILIDGEPLLLVTIKLRFPGTKIVALLNPFDVVNPANQLSSQLFFKDCYSKADVAIVHGMWTVPQPLEFKNQFTSIKTILRADIRALTLKPDRQRIACILGGGTVKAGNALFQTTVKIAATTLAFARARPDALVDIYCGSEAIYTQVLQAEDCPRNVTVFKGLKSPEHMYADAKLVIARAGRNTISELLHLKLPALLFATTCCIRGSEQQANIDYAQLNSGGLVIGLPTHAKSHEVLSSINQLLQIPTALAESLDDSEADELIARHFV